MNPQPKPRTKRDPKYLAWIRTLPCIVPDCPTKHMSVAAHVRKHCWGAGTSQKPHDYVAIPLCDGLYSCAHHKELDDSTVEDFDRKYGIDIKRTIIDNLIEYFGKS